MEQGDLRVGNFVLFPYENSYVETQLVQLESIAYAEINGKRVGANYSKLKPIVLDGWWVDRLSLINLDILGRVRSVSGMQNLFYFFNGKKELDVSEVKIEKGVVSGRSLEFKFD